MRRFPFAQTSLDFFRHVIQRDERIVGAVFGNDVCARNFVSNKNAKLIGGSFRSVALQVNRGANGTGGDLPHAPNPAQCGGAQAIGESDAERIDRKFKRRTTRPCGYLMIRGVFHKPRSAFSGLHANRSNATSRNIITRFLRREERIRAAAGLFHSTVGRICSAANSLWPR
jgi:hypothetical protein